MTEKTLTLTIASDVSIVVPADLDDAATYVFLQQEDWFEGEAAFVRRIARPGLRMLDIGANLGFDTLCAARAAGGDARIWSFEPTPEVAAMLERSAGLNGFAGVTVQRLALGDRNGEIGFQRGEFSALNRVGGGGATVPMARLDDAAARLGIPACDLVKIDVEGAEPAVIEGGAGYFATHSPLLMFEIKDATGHMLAAARRLEALGYSL